MFLSNDSKTDKTTLYRLQIEKRHQKVHGYLNKQQGKKTTEVLKTACFDPRTLTLIKQQHKA